MVNAGGCPLRVVVEASCTLSRGKKSLCPKCEGEMGAHLSKLSFKQNLNRKNRSFFFLIIVMWNRNRIGKRFLGASSYWLTLFPPQHHMVSDPSFCGLTINQKKTKSFSLYLFAAHWLVGYTQYHIYFLSPSPQPHLFFFFFFKTSRFLISYN